MNESVLVVSEKSILEKMIKDLGFYGESIAHKFLIVDDKNYCGVNLSHCELHESVIQVFIIHDYDENKDFEDQDFIWVTDLEGPWNWLVRKKIEKYNSENSLREDSLKRNKNKIDQWKKEFSYV